MWEMHRVNAREAQEGGADMLHGNEAWMRGSDGGMSAGYADA